MAKTREDLQNDTPATEPRKRGRPKGSGSGVTKPYVPNGRPRGRPRKTSPKPPSGRGRGRPKGSGKKSEDGSTPAASKATKKSTSTGTGKRGRPRKVVAGGRAEATAAAATGGPKQTGRTSKNSARAAQAEVGGEDDIEVDAENDEDAGVTDADVALDDAEGEGDDSNAVSASLAQDTGQSPWLSKFTGFFT